MALSASGIAAFLGYAPDEVISVLLEITHASIATPIRVTDNGEDIVHNGDTYTAFPFTIELPADNDQLPVARLTLANVDGRIGEAVEAINTPPTVSIKLVLASTPNNVELEFSGFEMRSIKINAVAVEAELYQVSVTSEPWPSLRVTPAKFPAIFS